MGRSYYEGRIRRPSKVLQKLAKDNPDTIDEYYCDDDGHWIYLKEGYVCASMECGTIREDTVKEALEMFRTGGIMTREKHEAELAELRAKIEQKRAEKKR